MTLTAKQEAFAQAIADGMNQSDAYRAAYSAGKMKDQVIQNKASLLMKGEAGVRVKALREELANKSLWTREQSVAVLVDGLAGAKFGDQISAIKVLNEMQGLNAPTKSETTIYLPKTINVIAGRA